MNSVTALKGALGVRAVFKDYALSALSGVLVALAFPDYGIWPLAWVGLVPLFVVIRAKNTLSATWLGLTAGLFYFGPTVYWVSNTMTQFGGMPLFAAVITTALMISVMSCYIALFCYLLSMVEGRSGRAISLAMAPFLWVTLETVRGSLPGVGFPWARLSDSQFEVLNVIQIADITGSEGVSFIIVLVSASLAMVLDWFLSKNGSQEKFPFRWITGTLVLVMAMLVYGAIKLSALDEGAKGAQKVKVALVQGNVDQKRKWERFYREEQLDIYTRRTEEAVAKGAELVVWPETAAPFYFGSDPLYDAGLRALSQNTGVPIVFGAPGYVRENGKVTSFNRAWVIRPDGYEEKFDKVHLVPFGEYIPMKKVLFFLDKVVTSIGDMEPGKTVNLLDIGAFKAGVQICYEIIFPQYSREIALKGASVIINITNDSWYGKTSASRQSLSMAVFRAVENRIPVLRSAQSGVSCIIEPSGKVVGETPLFVETTLMGSFTPKKSAITIYSSSGGLFGLGCAGFVFGLILFTPGRRKSL